MNKVIFTFLVAITTHIAFTQSKEKVIAHLDKTHSPVSEPAGATYYRTVEAKDTIYVIRDYFVSGKLQMEARCTIYSPQLCFHGKRIVYHENGNPKEEGFFKANKPIGTHKTFYENGTPEPRLAMTNQNHTICTIGMRQVTNC